MFVLIGHRANWCGRPESNRQGLTPDGFSYHFGFRRRSSEQALSRVRGLDYTFTLTPARRRCCPSSLYTFPSRLSVWGLARDRHLTGFPEFEQFYFRGFPWSTQAVQVRCVYQFRHARVPGLL